jgi:hypothetical protein
MPAVQNVAQLPTLDPSSHLATVSRGLTQNRLKAPLKAPLSEVGRNVRVSRGSPPDVALRHQADLHDGVSWRPALRAFA